MHPSANPSTVLSRGRRAALAVGLLALLSACTSATSDDAGGGADMLQLTARSTVVAARQTYDFDLRVDVNEAPSLDLGARPFANCAAGKCESVRFFAQVWCRVAANKNKTTSIQKIVAETTGTSVEEFNSYRGDDHERGGFSARLEVTPGGANIHCSFALAPRFVVANAERANGVTRDYSAIDGKTHDFQVPVSRGVSFVVDPSGKTTVTHSPITQSVPLSIAFEPLAAPPAIAPKYDELAKNGVVKVFVPSLSVCHPVDPAYAFMQLARANEDIASYRQSLTAAGYTEVASDAPVSSETITNGQGWSLLFEKRVGSGKVEVRVAGPANNLDAARRARVREWNREATVMLPVHGNYYHPTCTELEGSAPATYRIEMLGRDNDRYETPISYDEAILSGLQPTAAHGPFTGTAGNRLWLQHNFDRPWGVIDSLATGVFGGARPSANQLVTNLAPNVTIDLGGD